MEYAKHRFVVEVLMTFIAVILVGTVAYASQINDPLPSWNDGPIKQNIIQFVKNITEPNTPNYVPPEQRVATFDNDGTLWLEQPMYTQMLFAFDRIKVMAVQHPEWKNKQPFQAILNNQYSKLTLPDIEKVMAVTHSGMTVEQFKQIEMHWLETTKDKRFQRPYTELIYQPMLEVMHYLRDNQFTIYIVSAGGQEFMRAFSEKTYHVPTEQVVGTTGKTKYGYQNNKPQLIKTTEVLFVNDGAGKPEAINLFIGKKPIIAFGNSDGDRQMLEWTQSTPGKHLMLLVHHDDAKREYAYDTQSKVGTFSAALMQEAKQNNWQVISMKNDWKVIFPTVKQPGV